MNKLRSLALALSAATMINGAARASPGHDITASAFVRQLHFETINGDIRKAIKALQHLKMLGIREMVVGHKVYGVDSVLRLFEDHAKARATIADLMRAIERGDEVCFVAGHHVIACVMPVHQHFPTGSAG